MPSNLTEQQKLDLSIDLIKKYVPKIKVTLKSQSKLHQLIDRLLKVLGNTKYLSECWTTLHTWIARPTMCDDSPYQNEWEVILHEGQHAIDSSKVGAIPFAFIYLFPQLLGIATILYAVALVPLLIYGASLWFLLGLIGLIFLLPLPAIGRTYLELRAYTVSMGVAYWAGTLDDETFWIDSVASIFAGPIYYKMWPFPRVIKWWFTNKLEGFKAGLPIIDPYVNDCKKLALAFKE
jgi:hypothetical protein